MNRPQLVKFVKSLGLEKFTMLYYDTQKYFHSTIKMVKKTPKKFLLLSLFINSLAISTKLRLSVFFFVDLGIIQLFRCSCIIEF